MASILKVKGKWRAQVRKKNQPVQTKTFPTKALAHAQLRSASRLHVGVVGDELDAKG